MRKKKIAQAPVTPTKRDPRTPIVCCGCHTKLIGVSELPEGWRLVPDLLDPSEARYFCGECYEKSHPKVKKTRKPRAKKEVVLSVGES